MSISRLKGLTQVFGIMKVFKATRNLPIFALPTQIKVQVSIIQNLILRVPEALLHIETCHSKTPLSIVILLDIAKDHASLEKING